MERAAGVREDRGFRACEGVLVAGGELGAEDFSGTVEDLDIDCGAVRDLEAPFTAFLDLVGTFGDGILKVVSYRAVER